MTYWSLDNLRVWHDPDDDPDLPWKVMTQVANPITGEADVLAYCANEADARELARCRNMMRSRQ